MSGMTSSFNLEQVFEFGQIQIYENIEGVVDVEVTVEKVIDGEKLLYLMGTRKTLERPTSWVLPRKEIRCLFGHL